MDEARAIAHAKRFTELNRKKVKILLLASFEDMEGKKDIEERLEELKLYLSENLPFKNEVFLVSDKEMKHDTSEEHSFSQIKKANIILVIAFKDAAGMALGVELREILKHSSRIRKTILCEQRGYKLSEMFTDKPGYKEIARMNFKNMESLKKKALPNIMEKRNSLINKGLL